MFLFDEDKSSLDKMQNTLKRMIFEIIYYLISGDNFPLFVYIFFVFAESFQIFYSAFSKEVLKTQRILRGTNEDGLEYVIQHISVDDRAQLLDSELDVQHSL
jgi:hypothetical protein